MIRRASRRARQGAHQCPDQTAVAGHPGDVRPVGEGVSELRIDHGPGYRVYFVSQGPALAVLLAGGDKRSQLRDIAKARELARGL